MPHYQYRNKTTGETWMEWDTISGMTRRLEEDKNLDVIPGAPLIGDAFRIVKRGRADNHSQFKDVIQNIKKKHPLNTIDGSNL